jgi:hypothetical protein
MYIHVHNRNITKHEFLQCRAINIQLNVNVTINKNDLSNGPKNDFKFDKKEITIIPIIIVSLMVFCLNNL